MANLYSHADFSVKTSVGAVRGVVSPYLNFHAGLLIGDIVAM